MSLMCPASFFVRLGFAHSPSLDDRSDRRAVHSFHGDLWSTQVYAQLSDTRVESATTKLV